MDVTREILEQQLATSEKELELAKAYLYRADGAVQTLKQLLALNEQKETKPDGSD